MSRNFACRLSDMLLECVDVTDGNAIFPRVMSYSQASGCGIGHFPQELHTDIIHLTARLAISSFAG